MRFRPCIDLHQGKVKQIIGSTLTDDNVKSNFESEYDSAYYAKLYRKDNLRGGHVIMLGAGNEQAAEQALVAYPGGLQLGGGVNCESAVKWLDAGAEKVILTSYIFAGGELKQANLDRIFNLVGRNKLVLDLSCRLRDGKYYIVTDRWQKFTTCQVNGETLQKLAKYCSEFLIHAVDCEGRQAGIDTDLIKIIAENSPIPTVYAGGIRSLEDIELINEIGQGKIDFTVGSALDIFGGKLKYTDLL